MPKILFNESQRKVNLNRFESSHKVLNREKSEAALNQVLRKKRSTYYIDTLKSLDADSHLNEQKFFDIIDVIKQEFPDIDVFEYLLGYVSICYLGKPYEVHTLDISGNIIHHFKKGEALPYVLEKARGIAMTGYYEFIEVYSNCIRAVDKNGMVSVIPD